jgi:Tol biopolymer transport system component/DNA-binding winged helix-turn-helix (wHTH) protein
MSLETKSLEFGEFLLDVKEKVLLRNGERLSINPKTFQLLVTLIENRGHLVEKDQLMKSLWADSFVEEANLAFTVSLLRRTLGDDAKSPRFIETVPRHGYRFIAEVRQALVEDEVPLMKRRMSLAQMNGADVAPHPSPGPSASGGTHSPGAVVALADWQHDSVEPASPPAERSSPKTPKLELVRSAPTEIQGWINNRLVFASLTSAIVLVVVVYVAYRWRGQDDTPPGIRPLNFTRLTSNGRTKFAAVSPDGRFIAYILNDEGSESLWLKNTANGGDVQIVPPSEGVKLSGLTFSSDGNYVFYAAQGVLYKLPMLGGMPKVFLQVFGSGRITFSPDGKRFAFVRHSPPNEAVILIMDADGTNAKTLASSRSPDIFLGSAAWSPDGTVIAVVARTAEGRNKIVAVSVSDGVVSTIPSPDWTLISQVVWRNDGSDLLVAATEGRSSISHQIRSLSYPEGRVENITNDLNNYESIGLTPDGLGLVAVRVEQVAHIWTMPADGTSRAAELTRGIGSYDGIFGLSYLSDGNIVYETVPREGKGEVWATDAKRSFLKQLSDEGGSACASPDGNYLIFQSSDQSGTGSGLFSLHLASGVRTRLTTGADVWPTFSPDGRWVVFTRWSDQVGLWKVAIVGGEAVKLTSVSGAPTAPTISPDGNVIAFLWDKNDRTSPPEIGMVSINGGDVTRSFAVNFGHSQGAGKKGLQWTPDGQAISYVAYDQGASNIWRQPVDGGPPFQLTSFDSGRIFNFAYSPDGKNLAVSRGTYERDLVLIDQQRSSSKDLEPSRAGGEKD